MRFTQYLLPDGKQRKVIIDLPEKFEKMVKELESIGCHFDVEILTTGMVSFTCEQGDDLIAIELSPNDENVPVAVKRLVTESYLLLREGENENG